MTTKREHKDGERSAAGDSADLVLKTSGSLLAVIPRTTEHVRPVKRIELEPIGESLIAKELANPVLLDDLTSLREFWRTAIENMTDAEMGAFDAGARPLLRNSADNTGKREPPAKAPEYYAERSNRREKICDFIRRVYADWLDGHTMTRAHLGEIDPQAYDALAYWLRSNPMPSDLRLGSAQSRVDEELKASRAGRRPPARLARAQHRRS